MFSTSVVVSTACPDLELAVVLPKGDDGVTKTQFGLNKPVNVELSVKNGEAKDIIWNFGDGATAKGPAVSHPYGKYGKYSISASAKCHRCGKSFSASSANIEVMVIPPKAKFDIKEKGSYYTVGSKLHLESKTEGDFTDLIWTVDGKELAEFRGKSEAVVKLSGKPCEPVIGLQAIGPAGTDPSSTSRDVRARYGWWAIVILALLALLLIGILAKLLLNNGPAGWKIKLLVSPRPDTSSDQGLKAFLGQFARGYKEGIVGHFWSLSGKVALMPISKLAKYKKSKSTPLKNFAKDCNPLSSIKVGLNNGKPYIKGSSLSSDNILGTNVVLGDRCFQMFPQNIEREGPIKYLSVALDTNHVAYGYVVWFVILTLAVIAGCAWAMMRYAI